MTIKDANAFNDQDENIEGAEGAEELYERFSLVVDKGQEPMRLDKFLVARIENASRNKVQQSIENGRVTVNTK
jgi:23S rRNA pseudouridine1911/1915/1917 synthase